MKKRYNLKRIKAKRSYSFSELAQTVCVHIRTVQGWHKAGLAAIEGSSPYLVLGSEATAFLAAMKSKCKFMLKDGQFYCLSCKTAVNGLNVISVTNKATIGQKKPFYTWKGKCPECGGVVNRFSSEPLLSQS